LKESKITAASIELNSIILGTEDGFVHVLSFKGDLVKSIKAHDRPVNSISVDNSGHTIAR
jgi:WD40 repeat protein